MAKDALGGHIWMLKDTGETIPKPTQLIQVVLESNQRIQLIEVYLPIFETTS